MPQTHFLSKLKRYISFVEIISKISEVSCSILIENSTLHLAAFLTARKRFIWIPVTTLKPPYLRIIDLNTLNHSVVHTYHPELTEQNTAHYQDMTQRNTHFQANEIDLHKDLSLNKTACRIQPSQNLAPRVLSPLRYSGEKIQILKKFHFQFSDLKDFENIQCCKFENFATHRMDVGKISTPFRIRLKHDAKLRVQRVTEFPIHHGDKLITFLTDL